MNRRRFVQTSALTAATFRLGRMTVAAQPAALLHPLADENDNVLVIVQLFGGNDGLNTVIPADDDRYARYRTRLRIPKEKAVRLGGSRQYLHPSLKQGIGDGLSGLFNEGKLAVVQGVGYDNPDLSHFRSTDIWLSGILPQNAQQRLDSGWIGRYFDRRLSGPLPADPLCMRIGASPSLLFQGTSGDVSIAVENPNDFYEQGKNVLSGDEPLTETSHFADEYNFIHGLSIQSNRYSAVVKTAFDRGKNAADYVDNGLSNGFKLVARLISGGLKTKVYLLSLDGFDTHANQGGEGGVHAGLLAQMSTGISAFMADLSRQQLADRVVGMTVSEFGRRPEENASNGTDHGAASVMFVFGNTVRGSLFGPGLSFDRLNANQDFQHQFNYRQVYDEVLGGWFGADDAFLKQVLGRRFEQVERGVLRRPDDVLSVHDPALPLSVYPNPTTDGLIFLRLNLSGETHLTVDQVDVRGQRVRLYGGRLSGGEQTLPLRLTGPAGIYLLQAEAGNARSMVRVVRL